MLKCPQRIITVATGILFPNAGAKAEITNNDGAQVATTAQAHDNGKQHIRHNDGPNTGDDRAKEQLMMRSEEGCPIKYYLTPPTMYCEIGLPERFLENYV